MAQHTLLYSPMNSFLTRMRSSILGAALTRQLMRDNTEREYVSISAFLNSFTSRLKRYDWPFVFYTKLVNSVQTP